MISFCTMGFGDDCSGGDDRKTYFDPGSFAVGAATFGAATFGMAPEAGRGSLLITGLLYVGGGSPGGGGIDVRPSSCIDRVWRSAGSRLAPRGGGPGGGRGGGEAESPAVSLPPGALARSFPSPRRPRPIGGEAESPAVSLPPDALARSFPSPRRPRPIGGGNICYRIRLQYKQSPK
jgi:hypothetical protein